MMEWAATAQFGVSVATAAVAFAVYRVQADKLFLEMREKRMTALDSYRNALLALHDNTMTMNFNNMDERVGPMLGDIMKSYTLAERELALWFGEEVVETAKTADRALTDWAQEKIKMLSSETRNMDAFNATQAKYWIAEQAFGAVTNAARPYVAADRRGLPLTVSARLWIKRRASARLKK